MQSYDYPTFIGNENLLELFENEIGVSLSFYAFILFISSFISLILFVLQGVGIFKMSKSLGIRSGWMAFVPVLCNLALGRVGQRYIRADGKKSASFGTLLLVFGGLTTVFSIAYAVYAIAWFISLIPMLTEASYMGVSDAAAMEIISFAMGLFLLATLVLSFSIVYMVFYYITLWRVFAVFNYSTATVFLVLSIFFSFLTPIFIFVIRNNIPKVTHPERLGIENFTQTNE